MASSYRYKKQQDTDADLEQKPMSVAAEASLARNKTFKDLQKISSNNKDQLLSESIQYLNHLDTSLSIKDYIDEAKKVLENLVHVITEDHELFHEIWTRYLAVANKKFALAQTEEDKELFKNSHGKLISSLLRPSQNSTSSTQSSKKSTDWRIVKKMRQIEGKISIDPVTSDKGKDTEFLIGEFKKKLEEAKEMLFWKFEQTRLVRFAKKILMNLFEFVSKEENADKVAKSILEGRFDKKIFLDSNINISQTLILGENGGLYVLLNSLSDKGMKILSDVVGKEYISDKFTKNPKNDLKKIIIGKGAFGTVKFAISLFFTEYTVPAKVICVKKTHSVKKFNESKRDQIAFSAIDQITDMTIGDYYAASNEISQLIFSPLVLDMTLVILKKYGTKSEHMKGYLMMELIPQNTGTSIFLKNKNNINLDWATDIKPYLIEVFTKTQDLLNQNIAMTDLKPDNTLYDIDNRKAYLIDLGGSLKIEEGVKQFKINEHSFQFTAEFAAPEIINPDKDVIDITLSLSYSCGLIIKCIKDSMLERSLGKNLSNKKNETKINNEIVELTQKLHDLSLKMMKSSPSERISIPEAIETISKIGDMKAKNIKLFKRYIEKIRQKLEDDRSSISINENIKEIREVFLPCKITMKDPDVDRFQDTYDLSATLRSIISDSRKIKQHQSTMLNKTLILLLGNAGSGKSVNLQIQFIEAVENWGEESSLPVYFNLANGIDFAEVIKKMDLQLNTTLSDLIISDKSSPLDLTIYVDSFDEGIYKDDNEKEKLFHDYFKIFESNPSNNITFIISCRSDYLKLNSTTYKKFENWFRDSTTNYHQYFMAPINYQNSANLFEELLQLYYRNEKDQKKKQSSIKNYLNAIKLTGLEQYLTTGFIFTMVMKIYEKNENFEHFRDLSNIYRGYVEYYINNNLNDKKTSEKIEMLCRRWSGTEDKSKKGLYDFIFKIGMFIAENLHIGEKYRLTNDGNIRDKKNDTDLFELLNFNYDAKIGLKNQEIFYILQCLPLKIEIKKEMKTGKENSSKSEDVAIGFIHDTIKNYFLFESLKIEAKKLMETKEGSRILGCRNLAKNNELVKFLGQSIRIDPQTFDLLTKYLRKQIDMTKSIKNDEMLNNSSSNSMSILVAANYSFTGQDLSNTYIKGANLVNGNFNFVDFTESNLAGSDFQNAIIRNSKFSNTKMRGINLFTQPELIGHVDSITCIAYSKDGKYIATSSEDSTCKMWDASTGKEVQIFVGHTNAVLCLTFLGENSIVTGSRDASCRIWNIKSGKEQYKFDFYNHVTCVDCTSDGEIIVTGCLDGLLQTWDVASKQEFKRVKAHDKSITGVKISPNNDEILSCSQDSNVKRWSLKDLTIRDHFDAHIIGVTSIAYSSNCMNFVTGSEDKTCKIWKINETKCSLILTGHTEPITAITFSPNGRHIASASKDRTCKIWDAFSGKELQTFAGHNDIVTSLAYSPDGNSLVTGSGSNDISCRIWDTSPASQPQVAQGHADGVTQVTYSPDGRYLASSAMDQTCRIWEVQTGKQLKILNCRYKRVLCVCVSKDGSLLATGGSDDNFPTTLWDLTTGAIKHEIKGYLKTICVSISPDGKILASCSPRTSFCLHDTTYGTLLYSISESSELSSTVFSPDGKNVLTSHRYGSSIWDASTGKKIKDLSADSKIAYATYSNDGKYIAQGLEDTSLIIKENSSGNMLRTMKSHNQVITHIAFSPDGTYIASCSKDKTCKIWNIHTGEELQTLLDHTQEVTSACFSPDGRSLTTSSLDKSIIIWELTSNKDFKRVEGHSDKVNFVTFSPDGKQLATTSVDTTWKLWDISSGKESKSIRTNSYSVINAAFSPDGKLLATATTEKKGMIWDIASGNLIFEFKNKNTCFTFSSDGKYLASVIYEKDWAVYDMANYEIVKSVSRDLSNLTCIAFSPDGKHLAMSLDESEKLCLVYEVSSEKEILRLNGHSSSVSSVAFSPDGKFIVSGSNDKKCIIWDVTQGVEIRRLEGHLYGVTSVAYSPDGKFIATGSVDKTAKIWDASSGKEILDFSGHNQKVTSVAYSPDGKTLATSSDDKTSKLWDLSTRKEIITLPSSRDKESIQKGNFFAIFTRAITLSTPKFDASLAYFLNCEIDKDKIFTLKLRGASIIENQQKIFEKSESENYDTRLPQTKISKLLDENLKFLEALVLEKNDKKAPIFLQHQVSKDFDTDENEDNINEAPKNIINDNDKINPKPIINSHSNRIPNPRENETGNIKTEKSSCCSVF